MLSLSKLAPALLLLVVAPASNAGITELAAKTEPTRVESMARIPKKTTPANTNTFSCWQEGRLIFQAKGVKDSGQDNGSKPSLVMSGTNKSIKLMDFKNGLCIFEQVNGRSNGK